MRKRTRQKFNALARITLYMELNKSWKLLNVFLLSSSIAAHCLEDASVVAETIRYIGLDADGA